jgi:hypothetical protein
VHQAFDLTTWFAICLAVPLLFRPVLVLLAQAAGAPPEATPAVTETQEWGASVVYAWLISSGLEFLKRQKWFTPVSETTAWVFQRMLGLATAAATALGIHWSFDATQGVLTISGLLFGTISSAAFETLRQFVFQEVLYRTSIKTYRRGVMTVGSGG